MDCKHDVTHTLLGRLTAALLCLLPACTRRESPPPHPHYVLGQPYQAGGVWWYPRESANFDETGLAAPYPAGHAPLTTDGEAFSQEALAAAHPTLPLPSIARLTDLQTGRSVLLRINDRGTPTPKRLVQVTRRVADLLGIPRDGVAQVRLTVLAAESAAAAEQTGSAPRLAIAAAPIGGVQQADLPAPSGARQERGHSVAATVVTATAEAPQAQLDGRVTQESPRPGRLWVRLDTFQSYQYAAVQRATVYGLSPHIVPVFEGRTQSFRVTLGPFMSVAEADSVLDRAIAAGVSDARIVVE